MTTVSLKTVGCRLNQAETARMRALFEGAGYSVTEFGCACDVCVIHGCTVTAKAEKDSLRLARAAGRLKPRPFVVLAGCVAEIGGEPLKATSGADLIVGQASKFDLPKILSRYGYPKPSDKGGLAECRLSINDKVRAWVRVQDGCDFKCAYCIVPRARGEPRSRPVNEILDEVRLLTEAGYQEMVLTGANLGCYEDQGNRLIVLLEKLEQIPGVKRIRLSSIEPTTIERSIVDFMTRSGKLCRHLHVPLQSGSNEVLKAMGRRYTTEDYRRFMAYALERVDRMGLGTDILAGFPGETRQQFEQTVEFVQDHPFSNLHVFAYSPRPGTRAAALPDPVPPDEIKRRVTRLIEIGREKKAVFTERCVGRNVSVLLESMTRNGEGKGWTGEYIQARVRGRDVAVNRIIDFVPQRAVGGALIHVTGTD